MVLVEDIDLLIDIVYYVVDPDHHLVVYRVVHHRVVHHRVALLLVFLVAHLLVAPGIVAHLRVAPGIVVIAVLGTVVVNF